MSTELVLATLILGLLLLVLMKMGFSPPKNLNLPPAVPGLPLVGNLLQLKEKKPHKTFTKWAKEYGPIYTIKTGASTVVVLNSTQLAKEAMVTRFNSISTRTLRKAIQILTCDKSLVAMSDYGETHKLMKKCILNGLLGANAQKQHRVHRDTMIKNIINCLYDEVKSDPGGAVNLISFFKNELFRLAFKQALGRDVEPIYVEELGMKLSESQMFDILVVHPIKGLIEVDWRDFFPYLRWIPNKSMELKVQKMDFQRNAVMKALIEEQKKRIKSGEHKDCYLDFLLAEAETLTEKQVMIMVWEVIFESSDTTMVTTEWAMFELARNLKCQDRLYQEIKEICGSDKITEEHLPKLHYLNAVFHETLRRHSPVTVLPPRYVHEDIELGGFHIAAGSEIAINIYGCNMDKKEWEEPEEWKPERFLTGEYEPVDLYKTMAFGGGKRVCTGTLQAFSIACTAIGRFVQEFEWRLVEGEEENTDTLTLTTHKLHPVLANITPRG